MLKVNDLFEGFSKRETSPFEFGQQCSLTSTQALNESSFGPLLAHLGLLLVSFLAF